MTARLTLDAGGLIALERGDRHVALLLEAVTQAGQTGQRRRTGPKAQTGQICIPAGVLAQVWRDGARQSRIARLLASAECHVVPLTEPSARAAGVLCGRRGTRDVVDASVVLCARSRRHAVVTSDPDDLHRLDPSLRLVVVR